MSDKQIKYLKDYTPTNYLVETIDLTFIIAEDQTVQVNNIATYIKNPKTGNNDLTLDGEAKLVSLALDNHELCDNEYSLNNHQLYLSNLPDKFTLSVTTLLKPWENKTYMGLYASHGNLITQCEAEGFRKITFYQDRPDVLATFTTTIITQNGEYNTILSNGNKILEQCGQEMTVPTNNLLQIVKWHDPFKKPSYLFALVIGNFAVLKDNFISKSGRNINLEIYTDKDVIARSNHAMHSLKTAMTWDEERFNLEYDLDTYMIVATNDFNMGAMENKGLNVFNSKYILADKDTATDTDFIGVEAVVGHEYFHNWTGNRVTCRDWFQLSLKEGLTVFRDHEFTSDLHNRSVKRITDVKTLRQAQFPVDSGPLAHAVRPLSYLEINNFYTTTIYEKGAEVVRMYQTILGKDGFKRGLALYLTKHDGEAATCEDFCQSMMEANNFDLNQFMLWYSQAGTPEVKVSAKYDHQQYTLTFTQTIPDTPEQTNKQAMLIPIKIGLLDQDGNEITNITPSAGKYVIHNDGIVLLLTDTKNTFIFDNIKPAPIPSLLRGFSAPVKLTFAYTNKERMHLVKHDLDEFNRFEHFQILIHNNILALYKNLPLDAQFWETSKILLNDINLAPEFRTIAFQLPTFNEILPPIPDAKPQVLALAINNFATLIGENLFDSWIDIYNLHLSLSPKYDYNDSGRRSLKNTALFYVLKSLSAKLSNPSSLQLIETMALGQYHNAQNMTDSFAVLHSTTNLNIELRQIILDEFYAKWQDNELVIDKWFAVQAMSNLINTEQLNKLMVNKAFIATNPNKIYALLRTFTANGLKFNTEEGYSFMADKIITIDKFNPSVASILAQGFNSTVYLSVEYRAQAKAVLKRILNQADLSNGVFEIVSKIITGLKV